MSTFSTTLEELNKFFDQRKAICERLMEIQWAAKARGLLKQNWSFVDRFDLCRNNETSEMGMTITYKEVDTREDVHSPDWHEHFWVPIIALTDDNVLNNFFDTLVSYREEQERLRTIEREKLASEWRRTQYDALLADLEKDKEWRRAQYERFRAEFEHE